MHKIFAKPTFLGKKVVFLPQCHSTNDELSALSKKEIIPEGTIIYTDHQLSGKGQRGNIWEDEPGKNVLLSVLLKPKKIAIKDQHYLNLITGLAVIDLISESISFKDIKLKWPNDVYVDSKKIAGILIENNIKGGGIDSSIVGIGLNFNQKESLPPNATSIINESDNSKDRNEIIEDLITKLEGWYLKLVNGKFNEILTHYHSLLYWKNEIHSFQDANSRFTGIIRRINDNGKLVIETSEGDKVFEVKEVQFID